MSVYNRHYARLLEPDIELLLDYQADHIAEYIKWTYDLRVGPGRDPGETVSPEIRKMALDLSRRRIDAVAETPDRIDLIEICHTAGYRTIGQLPIYAAYYTLDQKPTKPLRSCILCRQIEDDLVLFCLKNGYQLWIYPPTDEPITTLGHPPTT